MPRANSVYQQTLANLTEKIEEALEESWQVQVNIEGLRFSFFHPELVGVEIYTLDGQPLLTAERVRVRWNWFTLLFERKITEALRGVELTEPVLWLDTTERGGLRFPKIKKDNNGAAPAMARFIIEIKHGDLKVRPGKTRLRPENGYGGILPGSTGGWTSGATRRSPLPRVFPVSLTPRPGAGCFLSIASGTGMATTKSVPITPRRKYGEGWSTPVFSFCQGFL